MQGPNLWPEALPEMPPLLTRWQQERAFVESLSLPGGAFDPLYGEKPNEHVK